MKLGTKAETLDKIKSKGKNFNVLPLYYFSVKKWKYNRSEILSDFKMLQWGDKVIVRSSALSEDTSVTSNAGKYCSVLNVSGLDEFELATETVISSYDSSEGFDQVLVQPMLDEVEMGGVAFTKDPSTGGEYYVINYDTSGSTSSITSGEKGTHCLLYYQFKRDRFKRNNITNNKREEKNVFKLIEALKELELLFQTDSIDVEFAFLPDGTLYILQVRPLIVNISVVPASVQSSTLSRITDKISKGRCKKPFLCGDDTVYSVMTDWNPAEMIGVRPKPLALSLYNEIITDNVWAYQRNNYGYRNLRSFPLMLDFAGLPYIDVRVSFNSFVPAGLEEKTSDKLVNYYIARLKEKPQKHDKAEFDIVFSCYTLDLPDRIRVLLDYGFSKEEINSITKALREVTNNIIDYKNGLWRKDRKKIEVLEKRYTRIVESEMPDIEKIYWLLEDCKRYGTLPFAGLARAAFIAVQMLKSYVAKGIFSEDDYNNFMSDVNTVAKGMSFDIRQMSKEAFLDKYGHLRPGTYDITSKSYDESPEIYFDWEELQRQYNNENIRGKGNTHFRLSMEQLARMRETLIENGLSNDVIDTLSFIKAAIEGREYGKFAFTRNLSMVLKLIGKIGKNSRISKEELSYLNIKDIYGAYTSTQDVVEVFSESIKKGKELYDITKTINLPPIIMDEQDVIGFYYPESEANFITQKRCSGNVYELTGRSELTDINEKVVLVESADPGYDWIFTKNIRGFITMYGGANSHMAIRAGEIGIPAAIGVGEKAFDKYKKARMIEMDCSGKYIKILS